MRKTYKLVMIVLVLAVAAFAQGGTRFGPFNLQFVAIPPGEFMMGCSPGDTDCASDESPRRLVRITRPFEVGKFEVTQAQWKAVTDSNPSYFKGSERPVETVSWNDIQGFLAKLNERNDGYRYRLPTEAEWEYTARAGTTDKHGGGIRMEVAWYSDNDSNMTHPVGLKKPNAWGLHDTLGNVWEWVQDWYAPYSAGEATDPVGPDTGTSKALRGGSYGLDIFLNGLRVSSRKPQVPDQVAHGWGFRCVREAVPGAIPLVALSSLILASPYVPSGETVAGTIRLTSPAPPEGTAVTLESSDPAVVSVPGAVTAPAGQTTVAFTAAASRVTENQEVTVTAKLGGDVSPASLLVTVAGGTATGPYNIRFATIPPGEFMMNCSPGSSCRQDEMSRLVRITKAFEIGRYEVTQAQWEAVMGSNPSALIGEDLPVETVTWFDIQVFLNKLSAMDPAYRYRLPTEAEWEHAARAGTRDSLPGGTLDEIAWYILNAGSVTHPVGQKKPNAWGLYDVVGNVREWVQDWYGPVPNEVESDPAGPSLGTAKVLRGGGITTSSSFALVSYRAQKNPYAPGFDQGFRIVREFFTGNPNATALKQLSLAVSSVYSGRTTSGRVSLTMPSPFEGSVVLLESEDPAVVTVPESVTVPLGETVAEFPVNTRLIAADRQVAINARLGSETRAATLAVAPFPPGGIAASPFDMMFVSIVPGSFMMGCSPGDSSCSSNEHPRHLVNISRPFDLGKYEVTQAQWEAVMGGNPSSAADRGPDLPVQRVSWDNIQEFLARLNRRDDGYRYRLPTEAEWEYAARAGTTDKYAGGDLDAVAWHAGNSGQRLQAVGRKKPNAWGLHDMLGNAWEWVYDGFAPYPGGEVTDPVGTSSGSDKVWRGGGYASPSGISWASFRYPRSAGVTEALCGFRIVRENASWDGLAGLVLAAPSVVSGGNVAVTVKTKLKAKPGGSLVVLESSNVHAAVTPSSVTVQEGQTIEVFSVRAKTVTTDQQVEITTRLGADSVMAPLTVTPLAPDTDPAPNSLGFQFVAIAPGEFWMGCSPEDYECSNDESPRRQVRMTKAFEIGKHEVTQAQWAAVMGGNPSAWKGADQPVTGVSHDEVQEFLTKLNERRDGYRYRLPTEAEWEYAARAGTTDKYAGGILDELAWYDANSGGTPHPVGQKRPNAWGLYDVLGNVYEWVQDWYGYYPATDAVDPVGQLFGVYKVMRGGSFSDRAQSSRASERTVSIDAQSPKIGFRCVRVR